MSTITQFYLDHAKYIAIDENGNEFKLEVNYWDKTYSLSQHNQELASYAAKLLSKKHRVNFIKKMHEESAIHQ